MLFDWMTLSFMQNFAAHFTGSKTRVSHLLRRANVDVPKSGSEGFQQKGMIFGKPESVNDNIATFWQCFEQALPKPALTEFVVDQIAKLLEVFSVGMFASCLQDTFQHPAVARIEEAEPLQRSRGRCLSGGDRAADSYARLPCQRRVSTLRSGIISASSSPVPSASNLPLQKKAPTSAEVIASSSSCVTLLFTG